MFFCLGWVLFGIDVHKEGEQGSALVAWDANKELVNDTGGSETLKAEKVSGTRRSFNFIFVLLTDKLSPYSETRKQSKQNCGFILSDFASHASVFLLTLPAGSRTEAAWASERYISGFICQPWLDRDKVTHVSNASEMRQHRPPSCSIGTSKWLHGCPTITRSCC